MSENNKMYRYHCQYRAINYGCVSIKSCRFEVSHPIEYDSDIEAVEKMLAKKYEEDYVELMFWNELKGKVRGEANNPSSCQEEVEGCETKMTFDF